MLDQEGLGYRYGQGANTWGVGAQKMSSFGDFYDIHHGGMVGASLILLQQGPMPAQICELTPRLDLATPRTIY